MTTDRSDAIVVTHDPVGRPPERSLYEPRSDEKWTLYDQVRRDGRWHTRGTETVSEVSVETPD